MLCKMGTEIVNREMQLDSKKDITPLILKFFDTMLGLKKNGNKVHDDH